MTVFAIVQNYCASRYLHSEQGLSSDTWLTNDMFSRIWFRALLQFSRCMEHVFRHRSQSELVQACSMRSQPTEIKMARFHQSSIMHVNTAFHTRARKQRCASRGNLPHARMTVYRQKLDESGKSHFSCLNFVSSILIPTNKRSVLYYSCLFLQQNYTVVSIEI